MKRPSLVKVKDADVEDNFRRVADVLEQAGPLNNADPMTVSVTSGDNAIKPPGRTRPRGVLVIFRSAAVDLYDKGLDADGRWVINSSGDASLKLVFV